MVKKTSTTVVNAVRGLLKKDPLKSTFLDLICNQMSERTLLSLNTDELHEFILHLYDFFIVKHHQKPHIYIGKPNLKSKYTHKFCGIKNEPPRCCPPIFYH